MARYFIIYVDFDEMPSYLPGFLPGGWQHFASMISRPQELGTHSKLSKQSLSELQPPCKIPQGLSGVQHVGLKLDSLME